MNVIPERATLTVDARAFELAPALAAIEDLAQESALRFRCTVEADRLWLYEPAPMADRPRAALLEAARDTGVTPVELDSRAGHDAAVLAQAGIPTAMLFVRSGAGGVSHCPEEWTDEADVELAIRVLSEALRTLSS